MNFSSVITLRYKIWYTLA